MKTLNLEVSLTFYDDINDDNDIREIVKNVLKALVHECDAGIGIEPENSENFTTEIRVSEHFSEAREEHTLL